MGRFGIVEFCLDGNLEREEWTFFAFKGVGTIA